MAETTNISWCDHTWSPWYGCTQVSLGEHGACVGCYARQLSETRMHRVVFGGPGRGDGTRDVRADSAWNEPLLWNRKTPGAFVFPSMCDPFDNHPDLPPLRRRFMDLILATPDLNWLLLTKRPGNIVKLFADTLPPTADKRDAALRHAWPGNAAIGCTVVTQEEADRDIPKLLAAKAALKPAFAFVSMEPLLGPVDIAWALSPNPLDQAAGFLKRGHFSPGLETVSGLDWVITGGETDQGSHKARPSHPDWFRSLRDQCAAAGVAYHHKQNGEFREWNEAPRNRSVADLIEVGGDEAEDILSVVRRPVWITQAGHAFADPNLLPDDVPGRLLERVGKTAAGRTLDEGTHDARPELRA